MQYLVNVSAEVYNKEVKARAYAINAASNEQAQELAMHSFNEEYYVVGEKISVLPYRRTSKAVMAIILMFIPVFLSFISWKNDHNTISIMPNFVSSLYAILLYASFVVRFKGIHRR